MVCQDRLGTEKRKHDWRCTDHLCIVRGVRRLERHCDGAQRRSDSTVDETIDHNRYKREYLLRNRWGDLRENASLFLGEFSLLCLSRACLGKTTIILA